MVSATPDGLRNPGLKSGATCRRPVNGALRACGRNPSIQIRAVPTWSAERSMGRQPTWCRNPSIQIRAVPTCPCRQVSRGKSCSSQSLRTDQGSSDWSKAMPSPVPAPRNVAIPPYRSGQFRRAVAQWITFVQARSRNPSIQIRAVPTTRRRWCCPRCRPPSQSLHTDQGSSDSGLSSPLIPWHLEPLTEPGLRAPESRFQATLPGF
jgi:hypothetical protein